MTRQTSIYLDFVRFTAALAVFIGHVSSQRLTAGLFWQVGTLMFDAVAVFFALSGYVIAYVTDVQERSATEYAISRLARIYSVVIPTIVLTFMLDALGTRLAPQLYSQAWSYHATGKPWQIFTAITFTGRSWGLDIVPGSAIAYWSLNFEVWYYIIFGCALFGPRRWRWLMVGVAALCAGPGILALMPAWLAGVVCYKLSQRVTLRQPAAIALLLGSMAAWIVYKIAAYRAWIPDNDPLQYFIVAALFATHLFGFLFASPRWALPPMRIQVVLRWIAGGTFTLYLLHMPIAQALASINPWAITSIPGRTLIFAGTFVLVMLIAELTERRKQWWRILFRYLLTRQWRLAKSY